MSDKRPDKVQIFESLVEITDPAERSRLLEVYCGADAELRAEVEDLLARDAKLESFLDIQQANTREISEKATISQSTSIELGSTIGRYKIVEEIGEGGMGSVWLAEQEQPIKRRVALKLIKTGIGSKEVIARFESERQALALMNHPNIARILDVGTTEDGQPFFAMELVQGLPLTTYCDRNRLGINERLKLFADICSGVQHAHQKGIIHRDLKPSNILVAQIDGKPVPKVIDFGLAKALESTQRLTDQSLYTGMGQILGTLKYMSPEQAALDMVDIDTRTDIYSLGVILYELLTGSTPLDDDTVRNQALLKVLELIRDKEPVKASSRLQNTGETLSKITEQRRTDSSSLNRILVGDLDWVVAKALEKDRARRYESASGLAADVQRFLNDEPVVARPPSAIYRVRKFVRKNRAGVVAATILVVSLLAGIAGTSWGFFRAENARKDAVKAQLAESKRAESEKIANKQAQLRLAQVEKSNEILTSVFEDLDVLEIKQSDEPVEAILAKRLVNAAKLLEGNAIGDLLIVASMQYRLGMSLNSLGFPNEACIVLEKSRDYREKLLGPNHPNTIASTAELAISILRNGDQKTAIDMLEEALKLSEESGVESQNTLSIRNKLGNAYSESGQFEKALPILIDTLELDKSKMGITHRSTLGSMYSLGVCYLRLGDWDSAIPLLDEAWDLMKKELGPKHSETLSCMGALADAYRATGNLTKALPLLENTLKLKTESLGSSHPNTLSTMSNLALGYRNNGQGKKSAKLTKKVFDLTKEINGPEHPNTLTSMHNLAMAYLQDGKQDEALRLFNQTLELRTKVLEPDHPKTLASMSGLAQAYQMAGNTEKALEVYKILLPKTTAKLGEASPQSLLLLQNLAGAFWNLDRFDESVPLYEKALRIKEDIHGRKHPQTLIVLANLGINYLDAGRVEEAIRSLEEVYLGREKDPNYNWVVDSLLEAYVKSGKVEAAKKLVEEFLTNVRVRSSPTSPELSRKLFRFGAVLIQAESYDQAELLLRECLDIRKKVMPDDRKVFNTQSLLGTVLMRQKRFDESEKMLLAGYNGLNQMTARLPPDDQYLIPLALKRLVDLYEAWHIVEPNNGYGAKAEEWREEIKKDHPK